MRCFNPNDIVHLVPSLSYLASLTRLPPTCMQKPDMTRLVEFLEPLNKVISKASALTEGRRSNYFHHAKTGADSLAALAWIAYTGKDCGI